MNGGSKSAYFDCSGIGGRPQTFSATLRQAPIKSETSLLKEHSWKTILATLTGRHRNTSSRNQFNNCRLEILLLPAYLRGDAYLHARDRRAAVEFQKLLQHRGLVGPCALGVLAHVGLARAHALAGDTVNARREYESFLNLWAAADSTIPVLTQAKAEYHEMK
jgi:hypothetical protein